jgi:predicted RNase H-like HicB family nuclease
LGGEFANCHGQGPTIEQAEISLKLTINALRRIRS